MYYDVIELKYIEGYILEIIFENGVKGKVDLKHYITKGGIYSRFADLEYFKQVSINRELGVLCWPEGVDIAPETLYSQATGEPLPSWMQTDSIEEQKAFTS